MRSWPKTQSLIIGMVNTFGLIFSFLPCGYIVSCFKSMGFGIWVFNVRFTFHLWWGIYRLALWKCRLHFRVGKFRLQFGRTKRGNISKTQMNESRLWYLLQLFFQVKGRFLILFFILVLVIHTNFVTIRGICLHTPKST